MNKPYRVCSCREPATRGPDGKRRPGKLRGKQCPRLKTTSKHGAWYVKYEAPSANGKRQQRRIGPYDSEKAAVAALAEVIGQAGTRTDDKNTRTAYYLRSWLE